MRAVPLPAAGGTREFAGTSAASLSRDGRLLAFVSYPSATLVGREGAEVLFLYDAEANTTVEIARGVRGAGRGREPAQVAITQDGRRLAWTADTVNPTLGCPAGLRGIVVYDRVTGSRSWQRLSPDDDGRTAVALLGGITADATIAVFTSTAGDLSGGSPAGVAQTYLMPVDPNR